MDFRKSNLSDKMIRQIENDSLSRLICAILKNTGDTATS